jgi:hypothetical protein
MNQVGDVLCFFNEPHSAIWPGNRRIYSALDQARYALSLIELHTELNEAWLLEAAGKCARAIAIPLEDGGVRITSARGTFLEETPSLVPHHILNGWLTTVNALFRYAEYARDASLKALAAESAATIAECLPLYDMPEAANTRYRLTGPMLNMLQAQPSARFSIEQISVRTGGVTHTPDLLSGIADDAVQFTGTRHSDKGQVTFKSDISLLDYPKPGSIELVVECERAMTLTWRIGVPRYAIRSTGAHTAGKRDIENYQLPKGRSSLTFAVPLDLAVAWAGAAVPFSKLFEGKYYNVYHFMHISGLTQLYEFFPSPKIRLWRNRWRRYVDQWPTLYPDPDIAKEPAEAGGRSMDTMLMTPQWPAAIHRRGWRWANRALTAVLQH